MSSSSSYDEGIDDTTDWLEEDEQEIDEVSVMLIQYSNIKYYM
jgi:hypothetical protein